MIFRHVHTLVINAKAYIYVFSAVTYNTIDEVLKL